MFAWLIQIIVKVFLALRYRIRVKGLENFEKLDPKKGVLILPNHPAEIDPVILFMLLWRKHQVRPLVVEHFFHAPVLNFFMKIVGALPIPNFAEGGNKAKIQRMEESFEKICKGLKKGEKWIIYPAGKLRHRAKEELGSASGVFSLLERAPDTEIILVRTTGLWGSAFSRAQTGQVPSFLKVFGRAIKVALLNALFFIPKREVTVEFELGRSELKEKITRQEFNQHLEAWYNEPYSTGEPLRLIPYYFYNSKRQLFRHHPQEGESHSGRVPKSIQEDVIRQIAIIAKKDPKEVQPHSHLGQDLGLDSLDVAEIVHYIEHNYNIYDLTPGHLETVLDATLIASKVRKIRASKAVFGKKSKKLWHSHKVTPAAFPGSGDHVFEAFLTTARKRRNQPAAFDTLSGVVTYHQLEQRIWILAGHIKKKFHEKHIGVMLPASTTAMIVTLAILAANKIPVMLNWSLGVKNLEAAVKKAEVKTILSAWGFLDRLPQLDLGICHDMICDLTQLPKSMKLKTVIKGWLKSKLPLSYLQKRSRPHRDKTLVVLFTSGTEGEPKAVPLTHHNVLSNLRAAFKEIKVNEHDAMLSSLPPFHSFGFTVAGLFPLIAGMRVAFMPSPLDAAAMSHAISEWRLTMTCLAPTFLGGLLKAAREGELKSLKLVVTGAEKLSDSIKKLFIEQCPHGELIEGYGITECSPILTLNAPTGHPGIPKEASVGKPLANVELAIVHPETFETLRGGEVGLILARGPNIFPGYLHERKNPFVTYAGKEWYNTKDLGSVTPEGKLILAGRLKRFIKIGGEMVNLVAIEDALKKLIKAEEGPSFAIIADEKAPKPRIILTTAQPVTLEAVNAELQKAGFSNLSRVHQVQMIEEIPLLGSGKINYMALERKYLP